MEALQRGLQVQLIATPREDLVTCSIDENLADVAARNRSDKFDYLPVTQVSPDGVKRIVGIVDMTPFFDGPCAVGRVRDVCKSLSEENVIGANASIIDFVKQADTLGCRLLMSRSQISGLVNLSDLQRFPVLAAIFAMIMDLEVVMSDSIEFLFGQLGWEPLLSPDQAKGINARQKKAANARSELNKIAYMLFSEKVKIVSQSDLLSQTTFPKDMELVTSLRNNLVRANEFADTREAAAEVCKIVRTIEFWTSRLRNALGGD